MTTSVRKISVLCNQYLLQQFLVFVSELRAIIEECNTLSHENYASNFGYINWRRQILLEACNKNVSLASHS